MKCKYTDETETMVAIAKDDVDFTISGVYEEHHYWRDLVQPFLDEGGTIEPYVAPPAEA